MKTKPIQILSNDERTIKILLENSELEEKTFGQLHTIEVMPGKAVGNHYHKEKEEWLIPLKGAGMIILENLSKTYKEVYVFEKEEEYKKVFIPTLYAHAVANKSNQPFLIAEYSTKLFDPNNEDRFPHIVYPSTDPY